MLRRVLAIADSVRTTRYPDAAFVLAAGSFARGEETAHSDLDLVVIYDRVDTAYRESFAFRVFRILEMDARTLVG